MTVNPLEQEFREVILRFEGLTCSQVDGGVCMGPNIWLGFGELTESTIVLHTGGEFTSQSARKRIHSDFAAWRLEVGDAIICNSTSPNGLDGPMDKGLALIKGRTLEKVSLRNRALDLELAFSGGLRLSIFCDLCDLTDGYDNYVITWDEKHYTVGADSVLRVS